MFPIRCYTSNAALAQLHPRYRDAVHREGRSEADALRALGVERMCCRRMFLGYVELTEDQARFGGNEDAVLDDGGTVLLRRVRATSVVACD